MTSGHEGAGGRPDGVPGPEGAGWEVIDDEDVIGTASARLLSTRADRGDRLAALSLLGLLLDHSDHDGRVRLPLDTLARELGVEPQRVVQLLQRLLTVEAVRAEGDAVVVVGRHRAGSLPASRFLANLVTVLERQPSLPASGAGGSPPSTAPAFARSPAVFGHRLVAAVGVALVAMALATAPSGDPRTALRSMAPPTASSATPSSASLPSGAASPAPPGDERSPVAPEEPTAAPEGSPSDAGDVNEPVDGTERAVPPGGPGDASIAGPRSRPPEEGPALPVAPSVVESGPSRPPEVAARPTTGVVAPRDEGRVCPSGAPEAAVSTSEQLDVWPGSVLDLVEERAVQVRGTVTNNSEEAITIEAVEVGIGQGIRRVVASAGPMPLTVAPGDTATWEATLLVSPALLLDMIADVRVMSWSWAEPDLVDCPT